MPPPDSHGACRGKTKGIFYHRDSRQSKAETIGVGKTGIGVILAGVDPCLCAFIRVHPCLSVVLVFCLSSRFDLCDLCLGFSVVKTALIALVGLVAA